jgi:Protein of unknown function DUF262
MKPAPANSIPIGDLLAQIEEGKLVIKPSFQRRQVWTNANKEKFIETVLENYPFPEVFTSTGEREEGKTSRVQWLVDGQQRLSTLNDYYNGSEELAFRRIPKYSDLTPEQKNQFLDYQVVVRDLGAVSKEQLREVFSRINSTNYALTTMEKLNAVYAGSYKIFCEQLSTHEFFIKHKVFNKADKKRMYDMTFCVILVTTLIAGYYHRDDWNEDYLRRYNEKFDGSLVESGIETVFTFLDKCKLGAKSRAWKKTDLLTLIVEIHSIIMNRSQKLDPAVAGHAISEFYSKVDELSHGDIANDSDLQEHNPSDVFLYLKAATKATNDKYSRVERSRIISGLLNQCIDSRNDRKRR